MADIITPDIKEIIQANPLALATVCPDGRPNVIAVASVKVVSSNQIVITDNYMGVTNVNIQKNPSVCLALWSKDEEFGYKLVGKAEYLTSGKWLHFVKSQPGNICMPAKGAILVTVEKISKLAG
jgi:predicted pyridoxine 5'-phosphate oxidase superfamily flavin-nucleotide-binding protein